MKRIVLDIKNYKIKLLARTLADKILNEKTRKDEEICDNCEPVGMFYLGTTCPKCNRSFRSVKANL